MVAFISKHKMIGWQLGIDIRIMVEEACKYDLDFTLMAAESHGEKKVQVYVFIYYSFL